MPINWSAPHGNSKKTLENDQKSLVLRPQKTQRTSNCTIPTRRIFIHNYACMYGTNFIYLVHEYILFRQKSMARG